MPTTDTQARDSGRCSPPRPSATSSDTMTERRNRSYLTPSTVSPRLAAARWSAAYRRQGADHLSAGRRGQLESRSNKVRQRLVLCSAATTRFSLRSATGLWTMGKWCSDSAALRNRFPISHLPTPSRRHRTANNKMQVGMRPMPANRRRGGGWSGGPTAPSTTHPHRISTLVPLLRFADMNKLLAPWPHVTLMPSASPNFP